MRSVIVIFLGWMIFMCSSCKSKANKDILVIDSMKVVMWDMLNAGEWSNVLIAKDSSFLKKHDDIKLYEQIFFIHHITKDKFYNSFKYYESHPDKMKVLMDSITDFGNREKKKAFIIHQ